MFGTPLDGRAAPQARTPMMLVKKDAAPPTAKANSKIMNYYTIKD